MCRSVGKPRRSIRHYVRVSERSDEVLSLDVWMREPWEAFGLAGLRRFHAVLASRRAGIADADLPWVVDLGDRLGTPGFLALRLREPDEQRLRSGEPVDCLATFLSDVPDDSHGGAPGAAVGCVVRVVSNGSVVSDKLRIANSGVGTFTVPSGERLPCRYETYRSFTIQVDSEHAGALTGGVEPRRFFRALGLGVVRKDLSIPLRPPEDKVWIDDAGTAPRLSLRGDAGVVTFALGHRVYDEQENAWLTRLGQETIQDEGRGLYARGVPTAVILCVGGHVLPSPTQVQHWFAQYQLDQAGHRLWGGLVSVRSY